MFRLTGLIVGYFFGCIQSAYILGRVTKSIDIRKYGSGNSGTTNAIRVMGWKFGLLTFALDILKAVLAIWLIRSTFHSELAGFYAGLGVVIGHNWPFVLDFKGGKGIASTVGVLLAIDFRIGLIGMLIVLITVKLTKYVSLGSILFVISIPIQLVLFGYLNHPRGGEYVLIGALLMISAIYRHRANVKRLLKGTENKLGHKKDMIDDKVN